MVWFFFGNNKSKSKTTTTTTTPTTQKTKTATSSKKKEKTIKHQDVVVSDTEEEVILKTNKIDGSTTVISFGEVSNMDAKIKSVLQKSTDRNKAEQIVDFKVK